MIAVFFKAHGFYSFSKQYNEWQFEADFTQHELTITNNDPSNARKGVLVIEEIRQTSKGIINIDPTTDGLEVSNSLAPITQIYDEDGNSLLGETIEIAAGSKKKIRFQFQLPEDANGSFHGVIRAYMEDLSTPIVSYIMLTKQGLNLKLNLKKIEFNADTNKFDVRLKNEGNTYSDGRFFVRYKDQETGFELTKDFGIPNFYLLPGVTLRRSYDLSKQINLFVKKLKQQYPQANPNHIFAIWSFEYGHIHNQSLKIKGNTIKIDL